MKYLSVLKKKKEKKKQQKKKKKNTKIFNTCIKSHFPLLTGF